MNAVEYAERATLGALLLDPAQLNSVRGWLEIDDFTDPRNRIAYAAIRDLQHRRESCDAVAVLAHLIADPRARRNDATGPYLADLIGAVPDPARAAIYGRMVLTAAIHRAIGTDAERLEQAATADADPVERIDRVAAELDVAVFSLDTLATRWTAAGPPQPPTVPEPPASAAGTPLRTGDTDVEDDLLATLSRNPREVDAVRQWLDADDFSDPGRGHTYRCILDLADRRQPIDAVTVAWTTLAERGPALSTSDIVNLSSRPVAGSALVPGREVLGTAIASAAAAEARALEMASRTVGSTPEKILSQTRRSLTAIGCELNRCPREMG